MLTQKEDFMKKISLFLFSLIILSSFVFAITSREKGVDWLANNTDWNEDTIEEVTFSILALDLAESSNEVEEGLDKLLKRENSGDCWPKGTCKVKETALALLVLNHLDKPTSEVLDWLYDAQISALDTGTFWIQMASNVDGDCVLSYDGKQRVFTLKDNKIAKCNNNPWLDVDCIKRNFMADSLSREIDVDCSSLPGGVIISLIYQNDDSYYLLQEEHSNSAVIKINNACFGSSSSSSSCDYKSTAFATWVLSLLGEELNTMSYLESKIADGDILSHAFLYLITKKNVYSNWLEEHQSASGNFGDIYTTSFANLALEGRDSAGNSTEWLKIRQKLDGSWGDSIRDTSVVLFSLFGGIEGRSITEGCTENDYSCCDSCKDGFEKPMYDDGCYSGEVCCDKCESVVIESYCDDGTCDVNEDEVTCPEDCKVPSYCGDGTCDVGENEESCLDDCKEKIGVSVSICGDGECDEDEDCPDDCKGFPTWIIVILVIILLGVGFYFVYDKFLKGKTKLPDFFKIIKFKLSKIIKFKKGPSKKQPARVPAQRPAYPARRPVSIMKGRASPRRISPRRSKIEIELEKSLNEAKKLLGKKK